MFINKGNLSTIIMLNESIIYEYLLLHYNLFNNIFLIITKFLN